MAAISFPPLQSNGLGFTLPNIIGVESVGLVCDLLESFLSFFCLGKLSSDASSALLRVWYSAVGFVAVGDDAMSPGTMLHVAVKVKIFLLDIQAPDGCHALLTRGFTFSFVNRGLPELWARGVTKAWLPLL